MLFHTQKINFLSWLPLKEATPKNYSAKLKNPMRPPSSPSINSNIYNIINLWMSVGLFFEIPLLGGCFSRRLFFFFLFFSRLALKKHDSSKNPPPSLPPTPTPAETSVFLSIANTQNLYKNGLSGATKSKSTAKQWILHSIVCFSKIHDGDGPYFFLLRSISFFKFL